MSMIFGALGLWCFGALGFWTLELWGFGVVGFWGVRALGRWPSIPDLVRYDRVYQYCLSFGENGGDPLFCTRLNTNLVTNSQY